MEGALRGERSVVDARSSEFPEPLKGIREPPERLYIVGAVSALQEGLAVIGARKATPYGISCASHFASIASERGIVIISGGARGCDSASHEAAVRLGRPTVVFLGGGCDELYPAENRGLFQRVIDCGGAIVSEQDWGMRPFPWMFRKRNRLIAGLAKATLIVEAGLPSGTFSTADEALEASRDVLVVPGSITSKTSAGANRLIYQGATPVIDDDTFADQLFSIFGSMRMEDCSEGVCVESPAKTALEEELLEAVQAEQLALDQLVGIVQRSSGMEKPLAWLMVWLAEMQKLGVLAKYPNGKYGPVARREAVQGCKFENKPASA